jgi:predicted alpha/beta superfamily hydrolase
MKNAALIVILFVSQLNSIAQDTVMVGLYKRFESKILGETITYLEHLPEGYNDSDKEYPVLFLMNGQMIPDFANASGTIDKLSNERIPDMILIGISNTGKAGYFWSCPDEEGTVSYGELFYQFLKEELIPEINSRYRTNGYRILAGQSRSGLYVLYNYFFHSELFNGYVAASPMLGFCPEFYLKMTDLYLKQDAVAARKLYVSYGDLDYIEVLGYMPAFIEKFKQVPAGTEWRLDIIENSGHVPIVTLNNALLFFFSECTLNAERRKYSVDEIKVHFENLSKEYGFSVFPKAGVLFDIAIDLKNQKEYDEAIEKFKYLISLYGDSEIYYFCLGETYQLKGEIGNAILMFSKSLTINPEFTPSRLALEKLNK